EHFEQAALIVAQELQHVDDLVARHVERQLAVRDARGADCVAQRSFAMGPELLKSLAHAAPREVVTACPIARSFRCDGSFAVATARRRRAPRPSAGIPA